MNRRNFLRLCGGLSAAALSGQFASGASSQSDKAATTTLGMVLTHSKPDWKQVAKGLQFAKVDVLHDKNIVDVMAVLKINPESNKIRVFHSFDYEKTIARTIEDWQKTTSAVAMINGAQYMSDPYYMPCALVLCDGQMKGPRSNPQVRGMLVAEPRTTGVPKANLLDFEYDHFNYKTTPYTQGVQHWPILLDRKGKIKVARSEAQANRSVVARDFDGNLFFFTTENGFFTLYNFGNFLQQSNAAADHGFHIQTAMNLDGGYEASMIVKSAAVSYSNHDPVETQAAAKNAGILSFKMKIPGVIGVFPR